MYYFRDSSGNEVDLISEKDGELFAIEIKAGSKINADMFRGLKFWEKNPFKSSCILVYTGTKNEIINETFSIIPWTEVANLFNN